MIDTGQPDQGMQGQGGMTICINVAPDGSISVSQEAYEQAEGSGQPAQGIGEALKLALQMYQGSAAADEASQVEAGYAQAGGPKPPMNPKPSMGAM